MSRLWCVDCSYDYCFHALYVPDLSMQAGNRSTHFWSAILCLLRGGQWHFFYWSTLQNLDVGHWTIKKPQHVLWKNGYGLFRFGYGSIFAMRWFVKEQFFYCLGLIPKVEYIIRTQYIACSYFCLSQLYAIKTNFGSLDISTHLYLSWMDSSHKNSVDFIPFYSYL